MKNVGVLVLPEVSCIRTPRIKPVVLARTVQALCESSKEVSLPSFVLDLLQPNAIVSETGIVGALNELASSCELFCSALAHTATLAQVLSGIRGDDGVVGIDYWRELGEMRPRQSTG